MKSKSASLFVIVFALGFILSGCAPQADTSAKLEITYEQYNLENGLDVILHEDRSDPIVAVALLFHVGSNREEPGRTGFAHLFEHMMFQESQHVGQDQFFKKIQGAGGMLNGGTGNDSTVYFEVLPKNALEMALWLESDRLGFLRSTITQEAFANQQGVVRNEKRQVVDNRPYGHTEFIIGKLLYPESHPYNWQVIGSMEDLTNATLKDVHEFHRKWYTPRNCTLVVAGDFDKAQTKQWIEKYFAEIESGDPVEDPPSIPVTLEQSKLTYYEDNFARSPELTMVIPTVEQYHPDAYALDFLGQLMSYGKKAPLYKVIVEEKKLAPSVSGYNMSQEIAGEFRIRIRTFPNVDLDDVKSAIMETLEKFETESFTEQDVERIKAGIETSFYNGLASILFKSFQLGQYNEYAGSPGYVTTDLERIKAVTREDILRVYDKYIKDKPFVLTGFIPKGQAEL
ncbi:M16 family metallopeptidase, partial [Acidobacteriota bacterium]